MPPTPSQLPFCMHEHLTPDLKMQSSPKQKALENLQGFFHLNLTNPDC
jgi:hypothetical protein